MIIRTDEDLTRLGAVMLQSVDDVQPGDILIQRHQIRDDVTREFVRTYAMHLVLRHVGSVRQSEHTNFYVHSYASLNLYTGLLSTMTFTTAHLTPDFPKERGSRVLHVPRGADATD